MLGKKCEGGANQLFNVISLLSLACSPSLSLSCHMQGKGEFTMEFCKYQIALPQLQEELVQLHEEKLKAKAKKWTSVIYDLELFI